MVFGEGMNSRSIIKDVLGRCFIDDLFNFMGFHNENFVNDRIIGIPAFDSPLQKLWVVKL